MADYSDKYAAIGNLIDPRAVANVLLGFFLYAVVGPGGIHEDYTPGDVVTYLSTVPGVVAVAVYLPLLVLAAHRRWTRRRPLDLALAAWVSLLLVFYTYFNPKEAILYSSQILPALTLLLASATEEPPWRRAVIGDGVVLLLALAA
jgi:hypothetical protein